MKITSFRFGLLLAALLTVTFMAFGQDTNSVPGTPGTPGGSGASLSTLLMALIPVIVPLMIAFGKWVLPLVPSWLLPILAPALGALLDYINQLITGHPSNPLVGSALGFAGVGLRELIDQAKTRLKSGSAVPPAAGLLLIPFLFVGCAGNNPATHALVRTGVATGVGYSAIKYPKATPYLRLAGPIICQQASGTNVSPTEIIAAVNASPLANNAKTPEGAIALNGAIGLYTAIWDSYGVNAVNKLPELKLYLQDTCDGIKQGLPPQ